MDKQEWAPKCGEVVWYINSAFPMIEHDEITEVVQNYREIYFVTKGVVRLRRDCVFKTYGEAKAALIEKLTQALEEARKL